MSNLPKTDAFKEVPVLMGLAAYSAVYSSSKGTFAVVAATEVDLHAAIARLKLPARLPDSVQEVTISKRIKS